MKHTLKTLGCLLLAGACATGVTLSATAQDEAMGIYRNDFSQRAHYQQFTCYSSFGAGYDFVNGTIYTQRSGEQKAVLKNYEFQDFTMQADIVVPTSGAFIDGGFYIGINGQIGDGVDQINAYQICLLRAGGHSIMTQKYPDCTVKIYKFSYVNGRTAYEFLAEGNVSADANVTMKAQVVGKTVSVYLSGNETPVLSYTMEDYVGGKVGFRTFFCAMGFDNLVISANNLPTQNGELTALIAQAEGVDLTTYTQQSAQALTDAIAQAKSAKDSTDQRKIDGAYAQLKEAIDLLTVKYTYGQLQTLIAQADGLQAEKYTSNSFASLTSVLEKAKTVSENDDEQLISVLYLRLSGCIADLNGLYE